MFCVGKGVFQKMIILWFVDNQFDFAPDTATWIETIKYLQKNNDVYLVTGYRKNKIQFYGLNNEIIYIESPRVPFLNRFVFYYNNIKKFEKIVKNYKPKILLLNTNNFLLLKKVCNLKEKYGYSTFLDIRSLSVHSALIRNSIEKCLFRSSLRIASEDFDGITYITKEMEDYCRDEFNLPEHRSMVWTSGVDLDLFKPTEKNKENKKFRIIYHGTIADNRGLDKVIKALDLLNIYDIELFLLGNGNGLTELRKITYKLKLGKNVIFHPQVFFNEVPQYINQANIGILPFPDWPGWNTSSPIKLFEYLACGKPVIVTKIPAHTKVLRGKEFTLWAESSTPEDFAYVIKKAYEEKEKLEKLSEKARNFVKINYTWEKQAQKLEQFILTCLCTLLK